MNPDSYISNPLQLKLQEAITHYSHGHWDEAEQIYQAILQDAPQHTQANYNLGVLQLQRGRAELAKPLFYKALESAPDKEQCWLACIEVLLQTGQWASANALIHQAQQHCGQSEELKEMSERLAALADDTADVALKKYEAPSEEDIDRLIELCAAQRYAEAEAPARELTKRFPENPFGWKALGVVLEELKRPHEALTPLQRAVALQPEDAEAHYNLGNAYNGLHDLEMAEDCYRRALEICPGLDQAYTNLGSVLCDLRRQDEAADSYRQALKIRPSNVEAHNALGVVLHHMGHHEKAIACYYEALALRPNYEKALVNLGITLAAQGRWEQAECQFRAATEISPESAQAHAELGSFLLQRGSIEEAEKALSKAIEIKPDYAEVYSNFGVLAARVRKFCDAERYYRKALEISPGYLTAIGNLGTLLSELGRGSEGIELLQQLASSPSSELWMHSNLLFSMTHDENIGPEELYQTHRAFGQKVEALIPTTLSHGNTRVPDRKLNIGFVSGDLGDHPVMLFIDPVWRSLDKQNYAIYAYSNRSREDSSSDILKKNTKVWRNVSTLNDLQLAAQIQRDEIDILVDLSGHTAGNRLSMFALKPAPIQLSWIGYPATTGLKAMDYFLVDRYCSPSGLLDAQFTEKLVSLPVASTFQPTGNAPLSIPPVLRSGFFTFGSFNRVSKLTSRSIKLWSRALREVPSARMLLGGVEERSVEKSLIHSFQELGIEPERLILRPRVSFDKYLELHNEVDLLLDTIPYSGGTTTNHGLWMGVPTLTLAGETLPGRQGVSLMNYIGLPQFVADNEDEFVAKAKTWTMNIPELTVIRAGMRARIKHSALRSPEQLTRGLEKAFREMWWRWCRGEAPANFEVD